MPPTPRTALKPLLGNWLCGSFAGRRSITNADSRARLSAAELLLADCPALREETPDADFEAFGAEHPDERELRRLKARHDDRAALRDQCPRADEVPGATILERLPRVHGDGVDPNVTLDPKPSASLASPAAPPSDATACSER